MGEAWTIPCVQIWPGGLVPGVAVVAQSLRLSLNSTTTFTTRTRTLYLKLTLKDLDWKPWVLPFTEVPKVKVLINREMNEHDGWVASPDLPMLYLHFIVVYLKMRWNVFKFIDINGIKHAAEYLNSSKVKYDDDVIDTPPLVRRREALNNDGTSRRRRGWTLFDDGPSYRIQIGEDLQNLLIVNPGFKHRTFCSRKTFCLLALLAVWKH